MVAAADDSIEITTDDGGSVTLSRKTIKAAEQQAKAIDDLLSRGTIDVVQAGEAYEQIAIDLHIPLAAQVVELRRELFGLADDLGVGKEVRAIYHHVALGARVGAPAGAALAVLKSTASWGGPTAAAGASAGAFSGMQFGMAVGLAVAIISLFGGDDSDERYRAARERARRRVKELLRRFGTIGDLAADQDDNAADARAMAGLVDSLGARHLGDQLRKMAGGSTKLATFYRRAAEILPADDRKLFVSLANLGRWVGALEEIKKQSAQEHAQTILYLGIDPRMELERRIADERKRIAELDARYTVATTKAQIDALLAELAKPRLRAGVFGRPRIKMPPSVMRKTTPWTYAGYAAAGAGGILAGVLAGKALRAAFR